MTWDEAITRCARENATLASIRNAKEEKFVRDLQKKTGSGIENWIGMRIGFLKLSLLFFYYYYYSFIRGTINSDNFTVFSMQPITIMSSY